MALATKARAQWAAALLLSGKFKARWLPFTLLTLTGIGLIIFLSLFLPSGVDWNVSYRPAAQALLHLRNPYAVREFYNAPWSLLPILPLALLPSAVGRAVFFLGSAVALGLAAHRLGAKPLTLGAFLLSPVVMHSLLNGNIDWLVLLGFSLPPRFGLFFLVVKPQEGAIVALFWLVESWRKGRFKEVARVFWPVTVALLASFLLYGFWPLRFGAALGKSWNASLWPFSIPVGLVLTVAALRKRDIKYAMGASPCLSPYVLFHAWAGALVALVTYDAEMVMAVVGLWILVIIRVIGL